MNEMDKALEKVLLALAKGLQEKKSEVELEIQEAKTVSVRVAEIDGFWMFLNIAENITKSDEALSLIKTTKIFLKNIKKSI